MTIFDYTLKDQQNHEVSLQKYTGKVVLIVNTATSCYFTKQYAQLEALYEKYHDQGFEIIDIPCDQFGHQAKGSSEEIDRFCQVHYHTKFDRYAKAIVNGDDELPLYTYLKAKQPHVHFGKGILGGIMRILPHHLKRDIRWNFTKFLVDDLGQVIARYEPTISLKKVEEDIVQALKKRPS